MPYKDPEKKREYDRLAARNRRSAKKLAKVKKGSKKAAVAVVKRTRVTIRSEALSDEDLNGLDLQALTLGKLAIKKALEGLENLEPAELEALDVERLGEFGIELVKAAQESLEGRQVREEDDLTFVAAVQESPEAQGHIHALLQLAAADEIAKEIPRPPEKSDEK